MKVKAKNSNNSYNLDTSNFVIAGGEAKIHVIGTKAFKLFHDIASVPPEGKIHELGVLKKRENIIVPLDILVDNSKNNIGFSMKAVTGEPLTRYMSPKIWQKKISQETMLKTIQNWKHDVDFVHFNDCLIVDFSDMNFLMSLDGKTIYFIDTTTYETSSYPATAITMSIKDYHSADFDELTDWFSFGILTFNMLTGIHPYRGEYEPFKGMKDSAVILERRMREKISVFTPGIGLPPSVLPFDIIPSGYLEWYKAIFRDNKRLIPPDDIKATAKVLQGKSFVSVIDSLFETKLVREFPSDIRYIVDDAQLLEDKSFFVKGVKQTLAANEILSNAGHLISLNIEDNAIKGFDHTIKKSFDINANVDQYSIYDNRLFVKDEDTVYEINFYYTPDKTLTQAQKIANVMPKATALYPGVVHQNVLGKHHFIISPKQKETYHFTFPEVENNIRIISARYERNVLVVLTVKNGKIIRNIFRCAGDKYDTISNETYDTSINMTVLDNGIVILLDEAGTFHVFSNKIGSKTYNTYTDKQLNEGTLFSKYSKAMIAIGKKLYEFSIK